jgi:hypothetical protein
VRFTNHKTKPHTALVAAHNVQLYDDDKNNYACTVY